MSFIFIPGPRIGRTISRCRPRASCSTGRGKRFSLVLRQRTALAATVSGLGDPFQVPIFKATANYFDVLGLRPILGRTFLAEEEEGADVAIVTDRFWKARLGGDRNVIGRTLDLDGVAHTIVGVVPKMPVSWTGPNADIWTTKPLIIPGFSHERMMRGTAFLRVIGRLKPGISARPGEGRAEHCSRTATARSSRRRSTRSRATSLRRCRRM